MKRREFVVRSVATVLAGSVVPAARAERRASLLDEPSAWRGQRFVLDDGRELQLVEVEHCRCDRHSTQTRLHFVVADGAAVADGIHRLRAPGCDQPLYLQHGVRGPVACLNRLHLA